ncbi:MAG: protoporphyrinogen oxidase HemJ [Halomonadaceae bacterium]|nr:MAG: protoporphyrinogen oxidase HemJ [Halomonadaceae bacterium]
MLWIKAIHLMAMVAWFAGLFYLPRLFVYHAMAEDTTGRERFKVMERKLYRGITNPAMVVTMIFGIWLILLNPGFYLSQGWMQAKLVLIAILVAYHLYCGHLLRQFRDDRNQRGHVFYRFFNEFPVLLLIGIIILAVVRPF